MVAGRFESGNRRLAQRTGRRRAVLTELARAAARRGVYADSHEELLPWPGDRRTIILPIAAAVATLLRPRLWSFFTDGAVSRYALAPAGWRQLRSTAPLDPAAPTVESMMASAPAP